ncbi:hypothetical protein SE952_06730 [Legionella pneumophila]|nr:hypothetical protein [Legionella pneumophila]
MITKQNGIYTLTLSLLLFSLQIKAATDYQTYETVCGEPTDMLSFLERGGIATNPCVVPPRSVWLFPISGGTNQEHKTLTLNL